MCVMALLFHALYVIYITHIYNTLPTTTPNCSLAQHGLHSVVEYNVANVVAKIFIPCSQYSPPS